LPTAMPMLAAQGPDAPLEHGISFTLAPWTTFGLLIAVQKGGQAAGLLKGLAPTDYRSA